MSWTDERIEHLKKMWLEGLSASQIAAELANGITRNAVIGKVHRLGLSGRVKAAAPTLARTAKVEPTPRQNNSREKAPRDTPARPNQPAISIAVPAQEIAIPISENFSVTASPSHVTIEGLKDSQNGFMCRWPLGDPLTSQFRYCGVKIAARTYYCPAHARLAYNRGANRPRNDAGADRTRSTGLAIRKPA
jgi:GcrA cell cycle regulator